MHVKAFEVAIMSYGYKVITSEVYDPWDRFERRVHSLCETADGKSVVVDAEINSTRKQVLDGIMIGNFYRLCETILWNK